MIMTFEHHVQIDISLISEQKTVLSVLCKSLEKSGISISSTQLKKAMSKGALWLTRGKYTQRLRRIKKKLQIGDELHLYYNETVLANEVPEAILISDENEYSVWYKPFGMLSQGSKWGDHCTISRYVQKNLTPERSVFIVHRLDRAATGLMLIAHTKKAASALSSMFEQRTVNNNLLEKHYQIIVHGDHSKIQQPQIITKDIDGKKARSIFYCLAYDKTKDQSLIKVKIESGRKHQIRIHAAESGFPIVGDRLHGITESDDINNLQLCAISLSFVCPLNSHDDVITNKHFELNENFKPHLN